jgi:hypothetical protein
MDLLAIRVLQVFAFIYLLGSTVVTLLTWFGAVGTATVHVVDQNTLLTVAGIGFAIFVQGVLLWAFFLVVASIGESLLMARR